MNEYTDPAEANSRVNTTNANATNNMRTIAVPNEAGPLTPTNPAINAGKKLTPPAGA
ncbi:hypothetical protein GCM10028798_06640 [Humibacter antri]